VTVTRLGLFDSPLSMVGGLGELWRDGSYTLLALILLFSVALPYCKLALLAWLVLSRRRSERRRRLLSLIAAVGRWSMLDVLALAMVVLTLRGGFWVRASLAPGLYLFAGAVILAMLLTAWATRRVAREEGAGRR
jgi:paraquat-inducible protein A